MFAGVFNRTVVVWSTILEGRAWSILSPTFWTKSIPSLEAFASKRAKEMPVRAATSVSCELTISPSARATAFESTCSPNPRRTTISAIRTLCMPQRPHAHTSSAVTGRRTLPWPLLDTADRQLGTHQGRRFPCLAIYKAGKVTGPLPAKAATATNSQRAFLCMYAFMVMSTIHLKLRALRASFQAVVVCRSCLNRIPDAVQASGIYTHREECSSCCGTALNAPKHRLSCQTPNYRKLR